ncbi:MAG: DUF4924 family protein [Rikenellaceae bacterium]|nr:DUF4924 family protein [Rikenellaceae bacterium]
MYIAISKRKDNIAEYILYLWQLEDLLRALQFSPEAVYSQLVRPRGLDAAAEQELLVWYMDIANLLETEGKSEKGHLDHTLHLIGDLHNLHLQLMKLPAGENYRRLYAALLPELPRLRELVSKSEILSKEEISDTELLFRALYAAMLYRIKDGEKAKGAIEDVLQVVSPVVAELASVFRKAEQGEMDLFGEAD